MTLPTHVPNEPFRVRYLELRSRDGLTLSDVAIRVGWVPPSGTPDTSRVRRALGLKGGCRGPQVDAKVKDKVHFHDGGLLCKALEIDPWLVDL